MAWMAARFAASTVGASGLLPRPPATTVMAFAIGPKSTSSLQRSFSYGSTNGFAFKPHWFEYPSMGLRFRRPSDEFTISSLPFATAAKAGRLSKMLSVWFRKIGWVHSLPLKETKYSVHTVPIGFHQEGWGERNASHMRPEPSTSRRG